MQKSLENKNPFCEYKNVRGLEVQYGDPTDPSTYPEGEFDIVYDNNGKSMGDCKALIDTYADKVRMHFCTMSTMPRLARTCHRLHVPHFVADICHKFVRILCRVWCAVGVTMSVCIVCLSASPRVFFFFFLQTTGRLFPGLQVIETVLRAGQAILFRWLRRSVRV
jgi:hypothetical protein